jgi:threonine synthase
MTISWNDNLTAERATFVTHLECSMTGERYEADQLHNLSRAGRPLLVRYDLEQVRGALTREALAQRPHDMWRWRELLPVRSASNIVSLGEAATPMVSLDKEAARLGLRELLVKDEGRLPTGSFKARGLVMAVAMAKELGVTKIAMPTNGNAGAALAAYASRAGIETIVLCPDDTPEINVREIAAQGARVYRVDGLIDECGAIVGEGAKAGHWFDMSTLKEPYRIEGKKTMGLELVEQLGWQVPDVIFYPTGGGTGLIGMWKAFAELEALGLIGPERPRMVAVQAEGCAPMVRAWEQGRGACRAVGGCPYRRGRHPGAQGGGRFPDPARRYVRAAASRSRCRTRRWPLPSRKRPGMMGCCCVRRAGRRWPRAGWPWSRGWSGRTSGWCCSTVRRD